MASLGCCRYSLKEYISLILLSRWSILEDGIDDVPKNFTPGKYGLENPGVYRYTYRSPLRQA